MAGLRVVSLGYDFYPFDTRLRRFASAVTDGDDEMHIICLRQPGERPYEVIEGVHVHRVPLSRGFGLPLPVTALGWMWFSMLAAGLVSWQHARQRYDVVIAHNMPDFLVFSALLPKLFGAKVILDVQDPSPELMAVKSQGRKREVLRFVATWQERISTAFANHVITVGWPFEDLLLRRGVPKDKITLILQSADPKLFPAHQASEPAQASAENRPVIVMYYGTLAKRNGVETALHALALARRTVPNVRLDIMGRGEEIPALKRLAEELGVGDAVAFSDPCPAEEIADFIAHGDIGIIPYGCDGFADLVLPTKAYEMAWMGRPIIASDTPAIRSMFGTDAIRLCDSERPEDFAQAIVDLCQHPDERARMVARATENYTPYRWEIMAERLQQLLTSLSGGAARRNRERPAVTPHSTPVSARAE